MSRISTAAIKDTPTRLAIQKLADKLDEDKAPTFAGMNFTGKVTAGSWGSPLDVTSTRKYGFELHYSGDDYDVFGLRSRASLITTTAPTRTATGAELQAVNSDGISVAVLCGAKLSSSGKSTATSATISYMRAVDLITEYGAKDTITNLLNTHIKCITRNAAGEGSFGTGYGIYLENIAVGGTGQALNAGIYLKDSYMSGGEYGFTYGIDFSGGTFATAELRFSNGETIDNLTDGRLNITGDLAITGTLIGYLKYDTFAGDVYTLDTAGITLTAGTLTANAVSAGAAGTLTGGILQLGAGNALMGYLYLKDGSNYLIIYPKSNSITSSENLIIDVRGGTRTLTLADNPTLADWFDQSVKTDVDVVHNDLTLSTPSNIYALSHDSFADFDAAKHYDWTNETHNFLTSGTLASGIHTITGGATEGLVVNQGADDKGIILYGYDDQSSEYLEMYLTDRGYTCFTASNNFNCSSAGYLSFQTTGVGKSISFYSTAGTTFQLGDDAGAERLYIQAKTLGGVATLDSLGRLALGKAGFPTATLDVVGDAIIGDGTNELQVSSTGVVTLAGTAKRALTLRAEMDYAAQIAAAKPTQVEIGIYKGYSFPVWNDGVNADEQMFFRENVPGRWDGESDIIIHIKVTLGGAEDEGDKFNFEWAWEHAPAGEPVPATSNSVPVETTVLAGRTAEHDEYLVSFTIDHDIDGEEIQIHELLGGRLRRLAASANEVANEPILLDWHTKYQVDKMFKVPD